MNTEQPNINEEQNETVADLDPSHPRLVPQQACPQCLKVFHNANAMRMHHIRVHTEAGRRGALKGAHVANRRRLSMTPAERKKQYNRRYRLANIAKGLTAGGQPRKRPSQPRYKSEDPAYKTQKYKEQRDRYYKLGLNARGGPLKGMSQFSLSNIKKAQQARRMRELEEKKGKRIQFVYPTPGQQPPQQENSQRGVFMRFCPKCGEHLEQWSKNTTPKE